MVPLLRLGPRGDCQGHQALKECKIPLFAVSLMSQSKRPEGGRKIFPSSQEDFERNPDRVQGGSGNVYKSRKILKGLYETSTKSYREVHFWNIGLTPTCSYRALKPALHL